MDILEMQEAEPVSYTHLDVYKRQEYLIILTGNRRQPVAQRHAVGCVQFSRSERIPVSYTHLDVYKRQERGRVAQAQ